MTKSGGGGQFALPSPRSKFWGDLSLLSPRDLRPCIFDEQLILCSVIFVMSVIVAGYRCLTYTDSSIANPVFNPDSITYYILSLLNK